MSEWVCFVKAYASQHKLAYKDALKQASEPYRKAKGLGPAVKREKKKPRKIKADFVVDQSGEGIKDVIERVKDIVLLRDDPAGPPSMRAAMKKYGDMGIQSITVCRQPISRKLRTLLNITTLGGVERYMKENSHDELFHLYLVITLDNGVKLQVEKNQRVDVSDKIRKLTKKASCMDVPGSYKGTISELLNTTKEQMGKQFFQYDSATSNCQGFVSAVLRAGNLMTAELNSFVNQPTLSIFRKAPWAAKIGRFITDIAKGVSILKEGKGMK
jgi:hypothetical protein